MSSMAARSGQASGLDLQVQRAKELGIAEDHIFTELISGKRKDNRPKVQECLRFIRKGDVLIVTKLDRLARSAVDLHNIAQQLQQKGVALRVLDQAIDTSTTTGKAMFGMIAVFAEFERDMIEERRVEGMLKFHARLQAEGRKPGPEAKLKVDEVRALRDQGLKIREIMERLVIQNSLGLF
jgi:DNA invertase Pin-like site-specific DNA recombinase